MEDLQGARVHWFSISRPINTNLTLTRAEKKCLHRHWVRSLIYLCQHEWTTRFLSLPTDMVNSQPIACGIDFSNTIDQDEAASRHWIAFDLSLWLTRCASRPIGVADWAQNRRSHIFYSGGNGKICSQITRICLCAIALDSIEPLRFIPQILLLLSLFLPGASTFSQWICQIDARDKRTHVRWGRSRSSLDYFYWWCVRWQRTAAAERNRARTSRVEARVNGIAKLIRLCRLHWVTPNEIEFIIAQWENRLTSFTKRWWAWILVRGAGVVEIAIEMIAYGSPWPFVIRLRQDVSNKFIYGKNDERPLPNNENKLFQHDQYGSGPIAYNNTIMNNRRPLTVAKHKNHKI